MNKENKENGIENLGKLIQGASKFLEGDQVKALLDKVESSKSAISDAIKAQFGDNKDVPRDDYRTNEVYDSFETNPNYVSSNFRGDTFGEKTTTVKKRELIKLAELKIGKFSFSLRKEK